MSKYKNNRIGGDKGRVKSEFSMKHLIPNEMSKTGTIKSVTKCPTCGGECNVNTNGVTHYYISKTSELEKEIQELREKSGVYKKALRKMNEYYIHQKPLFDSELEDLQNEAIEALNR